MITEKELLQAIQECEAEPITERKICKLADFYIIYDHLFGTPQTENRPQKQIEKVLETNGDSDFLQAVNGKNAEKVLVIIDELLQATKALHPRMYDRILDKIQEI